MRRLVLSKHNCEREYENGDPKPDPPPDILLNGDSHRFTLTVPKPPNVAGCENEPIPVAWFCGF
jgi:hypothetical protein